MNLTLVDMVFPKRINTEEDGVYKEIVIIDNEHSGNGLAVTISSRDEKKNHPEFTSMLGKKIRIYIETC